MKKVLLFSVSVLMGATWMSAVPQHKIAGTAPAKFTIVYDANAEDEEGKDVATSFQKRMQEVAGVILPVSPANQVKKGYKTISFVHSAGKKVFDYEIKAVKGGLVIDAGGCWAMQKASEYIAAVLAKKDIPSNYKLTGSVEGQFLFPRRSDVNLRILDDNIWDYSLDTIPDVWKKAGIDCRDDARAPEFAQLVRAYMPDVVTLQEYNNHMHVRLFPVLQQYGYAMANNPSVGPWAHTPIMYNPGNIELIEAHNTLYTPEQWSNRGTKSFTVAVFRHKATGKTFAVLNTHLWWQGDGRMPGSTYARASQVRLMMAEAELIKSKYNCVMFITGDMNCEESTIPIQQFIQAGYVQCYKAATVYGNRDNGHHICAPKEVGVRQSRRKGADREIGAIDHCLMYNTQDTEVKIFDCIQAYFTVKLTDHYPNLIDVRL